MKPIEASFLMVVSSILYSCSGIPISSRPAFNNQTYEVDYLFEHDGCKVYRFYDQGNYVYFTNCGNEVTRIVNDSTSIRVINKDYW